MMEFSNERARQELSEGRLHGMLVALDLLVMAAALAGAYVLRYHVPFPNALTAPPTATVVRTGMLLSLNLVVVLHVLGLYHIRRVWRFADLMFMIALAVAGTMAIISTVVYVTADFYHRLFLAYFGMLVVLLLPVARLAWKRWLIHAHARGRRLRERRILFVGDSPVVRSIIRQIHRHKELGYRVVGTMPAGPPVGPVDALDRLVPEAGADIHREITRLLEQDSVDQVIFANSPRAYSEFLDLVALCRGTGVELKRFTDVLLSAIALVVLSPLFLLIAVVIRIDSRGPVFYRRRVIGAGGGTFVALKFRSMVENAHEMMCATPALLDEYQRTLKIADDSRVTRAGRILRMTSFDELPQLINVLWGEMSLVGPRMLGDIELARYGEYQEQALSIRPGITGLWQVNGRHETTFEERVRLDMQYVDDWSFWLDVKILLRTVPAVIKMRGAH